MIVMMRRDPQRRTDVGIHVKLFPQFPLQALLRRFAGFDLAARKLPFSRQPVTAMTLGDQNAALVGDDRGSNLDYGCRGSL